MEFDTFHVAFNLFASFSYWSLFRYEDPEIALHYGNMLRECIRHQIIARYSDLILKPLSLRNFLYCSLDRWLFTYRSVLESESFRKFFDYIQLSQFDIAADATETFKVDCAWYWCTLNPELAQVYWSFAWIMVITLLLQELLTRHKSTVAGFLSTNFDWVRLLLCLHHFLFLDGMSTGSSQEHYKLCHCLLILLAWLFSIRLFIWFQFFHDYNTKLLESRNYITRRQALKVIESSLMLTLLYFFWAIFFLPLNLPPDLLHNLFQLLGDILLERSNSAVMMRYVSSKDNLIILMNLLRVCVTILSANYQTWILHRKVWASVIGFI